MRNFLTTSSNLELRCLDERAAERCLRSSSDSLPDEASRPESSSSYSGLNNLLIEIIRTMGSGPKKIYNCELPEGKQRNSENQW